MTRTYADITVGSLIDGDMVTKREVVAPAAGDHAAIIRVTTASGGVRTEAGDFDISEFRGFHPADPKLVDVPLKDLLGASRVWAHEIREGNTEQFTVDGLHGLALEINRRRALRCIATSCPCRGKGH